MKQRAVQVAPVHVATRNAAVNAGSSWQELKESALVVLRARARDEIARELSGAVVAAEVQLERLRVCVKACGDWTEA